MALFLAVRTLCANDVIIVAIFCVIEVSGTPTVSIRLANKNKHKDGTVARSTHTLR